MEDNTNIEILLKDLDENDMGSILRTYNEINQVKKALDKHAEILKTKVRIMLKERKWDSYRDEESAISVSISKTQRESVNKKALKMLVNDEQYNQIVTKTTSERMMIITPKDRERLKNYGKK